MSTIAVSSNFMLSIQEFLTAAEAPAIPSSAQRTLTHTFPSIASLFDSTKSPTPGSVIANTYQIGGSPTSIDLTAAPRARDAGQTVNLTGKRICGYAMYAHKGNSGIITIKPHATNGYAFTGLASSGHVLDRGQLVCLGWDQLADGVTVTPAAPAVGASAKILELSGTIPTTDYFTLLAWFTA